MSAIERDRIRVLADREVRRGKYVLYWMQASVRAEWNPALEHAIHEANRLETPLLVCFGLTDDYPDATARHYRFLHA
jgi:deoxyribodipyrimidine photo-lyase